MTIETGHVNVRIDPAIKAEAEAVFASIGLAPSDVIRMLYRQTIMRQGLPFEARVVTPQAKKNGVDEKARISKLIKGFIQENKKALEILADR